MSLTGRMFSKPFGHPILFRPSHGSNAQSAVYTFFRYRLLQSIPRSLLQQRLQSTVSNSSKPLKQRTTFSRIIRATAFGLVFFTGGALIGQRLHPDHVPLLLHKPPSNAQTLSPELFTPPDEETSNINEYILNHPLSQSLRSNPLFSEARPHLKIPERIRKHNLTAGTLAGKGKIVVPPLQFVEENGKSLVSIFYLGENLCGHPGIVHGGLLATLLDEGLARCCFPALPGGIGVTANLDINYRRPVKAEGFYVLRAETDKVEGRKAWVTGWIERLGDPDEEVDARGAAKGVVETGGDGNERVREKSKAEKDPKTEKLVEASALFVEPRSAKGVLGGVMKRIVN